jgi:RNA recognition motif-containing protein
VTTTPTTSSSYGKAETSRGPAGANLFVLNIPENYDGACFAGVAALRSRILSVFFFLFCFPPSDAQLYTLFAPYGNILSATIQRDKMTGRSKGFGSFFFFLLLLLLFLFHLLVTFPLSSLKRLC